MLVETLFLPLNGSRFRVGPLVPSMKAREVIRVPFLAKSGGAQVPVGTDFTRYDAQIVPKIDDRRTAPKPVAVIDAVDHETRTDHERMRDHWIVFWVGVFLDIEVLLHRSVGVRKQWPLGSDSCTELLQRMACVRGNRNNLRVCHRDLRVE